MGNLSIFIKKLRIDKSECTALGFSILNCYPFKLLPGEEKDLTITYNSESLQNNLTKDFYFYTHKYYYKFQIAVRIPALIQEREINIPFENNFVKTLVLISAFIFTINIVFFVKDELLKKKIKKKILSNKVIIQSF